MNDTTKNNVITKNLRNWYVVDSILFNDHAKKVIQEDVVFNEYISLKSAMLSNLFEYYDIIHYHPETSKDVTDVKVLQESASKYALKCKAIASKVLTQENIKKNITKEVLNEAKKYKNPDHSKISDKVIQEKFLQLSLDNALIGVPLMESKNVDEAGKFKGKILEEAHKIMRDSLVRLAMVCKKNP